MNIKFSGNCIKAFDIGVASMKKGEKCILTCAPNYAYGESGSPPDVPPNSTLIFEVKKNVLVNAKYFFLNHKFL